MTFLDGLTAPWRATRLLFAQRDLWPYAAAPACIALVCMVGAITVAVMSAGPAALWLMPWLVRFPLVYFVVKAILGGLFCMVFGAGAYMLAALLALPFNDQLSERVEASCYDLPAPLSVREALPISLLHSVLGVGLWLMLQVLALPLQLVPGFGSALDFLFGTSVTAFLLAHQMMDGPMSRWRYDFREKLDFLWENRGVVLGLGLASTVMLAFPILNLIGLPICVTAGALVFAELNPLQTSPRS